MRKLFQLAIEFPRATILALAVLALLAATQLPRLQIDVAAQSMIVKNDPLWEQYQELLETYGSDSIALVLLQDETLFTPEKLKRIGSQLEQLNGLDFVTSSSSLYSVPNIREQDDYVLLDPFLEVLPSTQEEAQQLIAAAAANPLVLDNLLSADGKSMALVLMLEDREHDSSHDRIWTEAIEQQLVPLRGEIETVFQISTHSVRHEITRKIKQDQYQIMPYSLLVLVVVLGLSLRKLNCALVPLSTAILSIMMTLGLMALFGITVNVLTSIIPALLIIIGSTEDVHLMAEYHEGIRSGLTRAAAVERLADAQSLAILLAFVTTYLGLVSITFNDIELLAQFGWIASSGLLINFVVTTLFVPAYLSLFGGHTIASVGRENLYQRGVGVLFHWVTRFKEVVMVALLGVTLYFAWGAQQLQLNNNTLSYFSPDSQVRQQAQQIHQALSGMQTLSVVLESGIQGTFLKSRYLRDVEKLQQFIETESRFDKSVSFVDFIKLFHKVMDGLPQLQLPEEDELIEGYMGLISMEMVSPYVDRHFSSSRILVRHNLSASHELNLELERLQQFIDSELETPLEIHFSGDSVLTSHAADVMAVGQFQSLMLVVVVILLLVSLLYFDLRAGLIALIPNLFPVVVLFGVMGYFSLPLDIGTAMVAVIALGICVDDTIHFLSRYHHFTRTIPDEEEALMNTVAHEATPITTTSLALALGFFTLTYSSFEPVANFGALSALVMLLALFSNFVLTPVLLSYIRLSTVWDVLSLNLKSQVLIRSPLFEGMSELQIRKVVLTGVICEHFDEEVILEQESEGSGIHIILAGRIKMVHREKLDGTILTLRSLGPGELFGEISSLAGVPRYSRVVTDNYAKILKIEWESIHRLGRFHPRISSKLFRNLSTLLSCRVAQQSLENEEVREILSRVP